MVDNDLNQIEEILFNKKFIKDGEHYPDTKVLLVKGGTKEGIEIGLSKYCSEEYAKIILEWYDRKVRDKLKEACMVEPKRCIRCGHDGFWFSRTCNYFGDLEGDVCEQCGQIQSQPVVKPTNELTVKYSLLESIIVELQKENYRLKEENKTKPFDDLVYYLKSSMKGMVSHDKVMEEFDKSCGEKLNCTYGDKVSLSLYIRTALENMEKK